MNILQLSNSHTISLFGCRRNIRRFADAGSAIRTTARRCLATAVLLAGFAAGASAESPALTVATFNADALIHKKVHVKFGYPYVLKKAKSRKVWAEPGYRDRKFAEATERVAQYIAKTIPADVLVLTEVGNAREVGELKKKLAAKGLDFPYLEVCDCKDTNTGQHVAVLSRLRLTSARRSLPGREGYWRELDDPGSEEDTGISKGMKVRFDAGGRTFRLFAVHFASERGGHRWDMKRIAQASILRRLVLPALSAGEHVIVAGDLNDRRGDPTLRRVRGFDDIGPDLIQTGRHEYFSDDDERWTYTFLGERRQIDHILLSRSIAEAAIRRRGARKGIHARTGPTPDKTVSDHRPLIVTLTFPRQAASR